MIAQRIFILVEQTAFQEHTIIAAYGDYADAVGASRRRAYEADWLDTSDPFFAREPGPSSSYWWRSVSATVIHIIRPTILYTRKEQP